MLIIRTVIVYVFLKIANNDIKTLINTFLETAGLNG